MCVIDKRQGIRFTSWWTHAATKMCTQSGNIELVTRESRQTAIPEAAFWNAGHPPPGLLIVMYCHCNVLSLQSL